MYPNWGWSFSYMCGKSPCYLIKAVMSVVCCYNFTSQSVERAVLFVNIQHTKDCCVPVIQLELSPVDFLAVNHPPPTYKGWLDLMGNVIPVHLERSDWEKVFTVCFKMSFPNITKFFIIFLFFYRSKCITDFFKPTVKQGKQCFF